MLKHRIEEYLKSAISKTAYRVLRKDTVEAYESHIEALTEFFNLPLNPEVCKQQPALDLIVFSKDRALQLHALLSSYFDQVRDPAPLHLLYRCSNDRHRKAYDEVFELFASRKRSLKHESFFRRDLLNILESVSASRIMFLVDDMLFINPVELAGFASFPSERFVPSLRLGNQLSFSYWYKKPLALPAFASGIMDDPDKLCWIWEEGEMEWGFPLSLDGHIFSRQEIMIMIRHFGFSGPNSLERIMQRFKGIYQKRYGVCPSRSVIVNNPCNRVQAEYDFPHGNVHQHLLLEKWEKGLQMDYKKLYGINNQSVHEEAPIEFIPR